MEDSRAIAIYNSNGEDQLFQVEVYDADSDGNIYVGMFKRGKLVTHFYADPVPLRALAMAILKAAG